MVDAITLAGGQRIPILAGRLPYPVEAHSALLETPMPLVRLFPSMIASDLAHLADEIAGVTAAGVDGLHFDVMDGNFVPDITVGALVIRSARPLSTLPFDAHLMVTQPDVLIPGIIQAGANRVSVHPEIGGHLQRTLTHIRDLGAQPGVAINPATSPDAIEWVLDDMDYALVMSVNPGFSGQEFIPASIRKIEALSRLIAKSGREVRIMVDGGVSPKNIRELVDAGASDFVTGAGLFAHRPLPDRVKQYRQALA
jgi:ribulose-phosphate 3-epimerase